MISRTFEGLVSRSMGQVINVVVSIELAWDPETSPLAVTMIVSVPDENEVAWTFSRDLLAMGAKSLSPVGQGDVRFRLDGFHANLIVCLRNETGHADILLPRGEVEAFLDETLGHSKFGEECVGELVDDFLKELFEA